MKSGTFILLAALCFQLMQPTFYCEELMEVWLDAEDSDKQIFKTINILFSKHPYLLKFFFDPNKPKIKYEPLNMIRASHGMSSGEQVLIKIALDIWSGGGNAKVCQILETLDDANFTNAINALVLTRRNRF
jgi:hypothetical protein